MLTALSILAVLMIAMLALGVGFHSWASEGKAVAAADAPAYETYYVPEKSRFAVLATTLGLVNSRKSGHRDVIEAIRYQPPEFLRRNFKSVMTAL